MLKKAWDAISSQTFTSYFRKPIILIGNGEKVMNNEEDPFKWLEDDDVEEDPVQTLGAGLSILKERFADQTDADISLDEYHAEGEPIIKPGIKEVQKAIGILEDFNLYSKFGKAMMRSFKELNFNVEIEYIFNKKYVSCKKYFLCIKN